MRKKPSTSSNVPGTNPDLILSGQLILIDDLGVMIQGESGLGKSDLCLELLHHGHQMVADDVIQIWQQNDRLIGSAPQKTQNKIAIRNLGVLNISSVFGENAIRAESSIDLIIRLYIPTADEWHSNSLKWQKRMEKFCSVTLPVYELACTPQRPLRTLVEILVKLHNHCKDDLD